MQKNQMTFILGLVLAMVITVFALTNANAVTINLLIYKFQASQALIILFSATIGASIVVLLGFVSHIKMKFEIKSLKKENVTLKKKIDELTPETPNAIDSKEVSSSNLGVEMPNGIEGE